MLIAKRGLLVIGIQLVKGTKLGVRLQDSGKGKEAVDGVTVKGDLGAGLDIGKEIPDPEVMVNMLKNKISNVKESRFGSGIIRKGKFFREVDFKAEIGLPLFVLLV